MSTDILVKRLQAWKDALRRELALVAPLSDPRSFAMRLLVSQPGAPNEPPFLKELHRVLCENASAFYEDDEGRARRGRMEEWLGREDSSLHTPANWLKIVIEDLPLRLIVVINPEEWKAGEKSPLDAAFWDSRDSFFLRRICWLDCRQLLDDSPLALPKSPVGDASKDKATVRAWLQRLRLLWIRHLSEEVTKLWDNNTKDNQLNVLVSLLEAQDASGVPEDSRLDPPETVPLIWRDSEANRSGKSGLFRIDFEKLDVQRKDWQATAGLLPNELNNNQRNLLYRRHAVAAIFDGEEWRANLRLFGSDVDSPYENNTEATSGYFNRLVSQHVVTGAGRLFSLLDAALGSGEGGDEFPPIVFGAAEQGSIRLGIADERFQQWMLGNDKQQRGWVIAQRVTPVFLKDASQNLRGQPRCDGMPHVALACDNNDYSPSFCFDKPPGTNLLWADQHRGLDALIIHQGLLDKVFGAQYSRQQLTAKMLALKAAIPFVFVTSGRGRPENLPWGCKFLPYAAIEGAIHGGYFEKALLWSGMVAS